MFYTYYIFWTDLLCYRYMMDILPITDWSQESVRPALNLVLRRLERLFSKIYKKHVFRVSDNTVRMFGLVPIWRLRLFKAKSIARYIAQMGKEPILAIQLALNVGKHQRKTSQTPGVYGPLHLSFFSQK